jgi:hypothetical protein
MAKKKLDKEVILEDNEEIVEEVEEQEPEFEFDAQAFTPVYNKERKEYDMYILKLNTTTNEVALEIEEMHYSTPYRAGFDLQNRNATEMNRQLKLRK